MIRKSVPVAVLALLLVLVFTGTALAKLVFFEGHGAADKKVKVLFDVKGPDNGYGEVIDGRIEDFSISRVLETITCPEGPGTLRTGYVFQHPIKLDNELDFAAKVQVGNFTAQVKGEFPRGFAARGWFRWSGTEQDCTLDTGRVHWNAYSFKMPHAPRSSADSISRWRNP